LPPSVGAGTDVARSGTMTVLALPAARLKPTSPSLTYWAVSKPSTV